MGAASTTLRAPRLRATWQAAVAVAPVATPSSTMTAVLPASGIRARPPRKRSERRRSSARAACSTAAISTSLRCAARTTDSLSTLTPPSPIAPKANSGWHGTPSLRTTRMSSGACRALATSNATGTPPRGKPRTTLSPPISGCRCGASCRPASRRSSNTSCLDRQWLVTFCCAQIALTKPAIECSGRWRAMSASLTMPTSR